MEEIRLRDLSIFQDFIHMGEEEGREKARQEAVVSLRLVLLTLVSNHYPTLLKRAKVQADHMKTPEILTDVLNKLARATTTPQAQQVLSLWRTPKKKSQPE